MTVESYSLAIVCLYSYNLELGYWKIDSEKKYIFRWITDKLIVDVHIFSIGKLCSSAELRKFTPQDSLAHSV